MIRAGHTSRIEEMRKAYRLAQEERSIFGHSEKKQVYMNMCLIPNGFRYLARSIFNLARNIFHHNSQLTFHTDSHAHYGGKEGK
jgi:hypothetical protein